MLVFSPKPYGQTAKWPTYVASGNPQETRNIATEQAWEQAGLVTIPPIGISEHYLPPYYGSLRHANDVGVGAIASSDFGFGPRMLGAGLDNYRVGLGSGQQVANASNTLGTGIVASQSTAIATSLGLAVPVVGVAIAAVSLLIGMWINRVGPKQKVATTKIVNDAEPLLKQNLAAFQQSDQTLENQQASLDLFNQVWARVVDACSNPAYGNPGKNCIEDRQRGGKWDWFSYYYDPIANAKVVPAATLAISNTENLAGGILSPVLGQNWELLLGGGLLLIGLVSFLDSDKKGRR